MKHLVLLLTAVLLTGCRKPDQGQPAGDRIISLAPNLTEIIYAIGAGNTLVGRTSACDFPPEVKSVPVVGGFGTPSLEMLVSLKPTLIVEVDLEDKSIGPKIDDLHLKRQHIPCKTLDDIPSAILALGRSVHHETEARELAGRLAKGIADLRGKPPAGPAPTVFAEIWGDPLMTAGTNSFVSELITLAGGRNIGDEIRNEYAPVSSEWVVSRNPDIILCLETPAGGSARQLVLQRPGWQKVSAVASGRVYDKLKTDILTRPGPRVLDGIEELNSRITGKRAPE